jgi:hypothetical protein
MPSPSAWASRGSRMRLEPADQHLARGRVVEAHHAFHERGLARAVLAQKRVERPRLHPDRHVVERGEGAEAHGHAERLDPQRARACSRGELTAGPRSGSALSLTAPKTPPCILTILSAASWLPRSVAPQQSSAQAFEAAVVRLAHRGVDADVGGDAGQDQVVDAARAQDQLEVGGAERPLAGLVDDDLARFGVELGDDVPARLAPDRILPQGPGSPMPAPICCERQRLLAGRSARSGRCPSRVWMMW